MLTHGNMASNVACSMDAFGFGTKEEVSVSFLPLSHVTARHVDFALLYRGVTLAYCPDIAQLARALTEVRPDIFIAVPRVYEKIRQQVIVKTTAFPASAIYRWALSIGQRSPRRHSCWNYPARPRLENCEPAGIFQVRAGMGGKAEEFISGGAPLGKELAEWYADIGIPIHEGYGLTETSPVIAVNTPGTHKIGTVGKPLANVEVRIADDGEVLVRGPSVFKGYWNRPEETHATRLWTAGSRRATSAISTARDFFRSPIARRI
jgi:long-chain acyl-CoA synthetase